VTVGNNVTIWSGNHLGHGCQIHDHVFITSHVCISGHTIIGERSFLGVNSTFKDFIAVGKRVFVAMDASVVKDIPDDSVILGAKSSVLLPGDPLGEKIRKGYFNL
jgi:acyl-[acyl carrier protein]--UDP-N-acetylglucosamine O-acyltransferase